MTTEALTVCRDSIAVHSKSFSLASKLLPAHSQDDAAVLYAWCRRADDAIDDTPREHQDAELARLRDELDAVYRGATLLDPVLDQFQRVVRTYEIPREYPQELLAGMEMDARDQSYPDMPTLLHYCYRVASTVGLMMSHVIGLSRPDAMTNAAHLGIAMQLTNICRDVLEDWERDRLYLPDDLLARHGVGWLRDHLGGAFPDEATHGVARAVAELLAVADDYYRSGDRGLSALPWRAAFAIRSARLVYSAIGTRIARQHFDVRAGRVYVSKPAKLWLVGRAALAALAELPVRAVRTLRHNAPHVVPNNRIEFPHDVVRA